MNEKLIAELRQLAHEVFIYIDPTDTWGIALQRAADALEAAGGTHEQMATMMLTQAMFLHAASKNHPGEFEDCQVPICKIAHKLQAGADVDFVKVWRDKESSWLARIAELEAEVGRLGEQLSCFYSDPIYIEADPADKEAE